MSEEQESLMSRRDLLKSSGRIAAASALAGAAIPSVHAGEDNTVQLALVGCGGRGTGAIVNALAAQYGPAKLVAMADVVQSKMQTSYKTLTRNPQRAKMVDVPPERKFIGFEAYRQAMDCLRPGDVAVFATPAAFRWVHFQYAIEKGLNVFMEKPVTVDGPTSRKMLALAEKSVAKDLKVGVGLMCRHCAARRELYDRIKAGEIGDILTLRAYRMTGPTSTAFTLPKPEGISELMYQIKRFVAFLWASGGAVSDFLIHNLDECCWMKDAWPVRAKASGGRHYRGDYIDQNFDNYSVEYTFADGTKLFLYGRNLDGAHWEFASYAHGSKGSAVISTRAHAPAKSRIYRGQNMDESQTPVWAFPQPEPSPYQLEWDHLLQAIRQDKPHNEAKRGVEASLVASMGRLAAHTGQVITFDQMLNHEHEFAPGVDKLTKDSEAPIKVGPDGKYPVPQPGIERQREY